MGYILMRASGPRIAISCSSDTAWPPRITRKLLRRTVGRQTTRFSNWRIAWVFWETTRKKIDVLMKLKNTHPDSRYLAEARIRKSQYTPKTGQK